MHYYFIDSPLVSPRFAKNVGRIETRLADLGIRGKVTRLSPLHNLAACVRDALSAGADTLVAIGNDGLVSRMVSGMKTHPRLTIGMIPLGPGTQHLARMLGIPEGMPACDTLAARRTEMLDVGVVNGSELFVSSAEVAMLSCSIACDRKYTLRILPTMHAAVLNLMSFTLAYPPAHPTDGNFTVYLTNPRTSSRWFRTSVLPPHSTFTARTVDITPDHGECAITIDGFRRMRAPLTLEVLPRHLSYIVGKDRKF